MSYHDEQTRLADQSDDDGPACPKCGGDNVEWVQCWQCQGDGGFHDCSEDCCCCLDKDEITVDCEECGGDGGYLICHGDCMTEAKAGSETK